MTNHTLQNLLGQNVIELDFVRRHPKAGWGDIRGLFGTTNYDILNGDFGTYVLGFHPPKGVGMGYDYKSKNLCVVWDIFRQEYRVFGAEQVNIRRQYSVTTEEGLQEFMDYFEEHIKHLSNDDKLKFMGYNGDYSVLQKTPEKDKPSFWNKVDKKYEGFKDRAVSFGKKVKKSAFGFVKKVAGFFGKK